MKTIFHLFLLLFVASGCAGRTENERLVEAFAEEEIQAVVTERGVVVLVPDVLFEFDSDVLTPKAERRAEKMAAVISEFPELRPILVEGHTDAMGNAAYNLDLSFRRAQKVANALADAGIDPARLTSQGLGETRPSAPNKHPDGRDNPEGRRLNRRVEVVIENR